ncbi:flavin monoamine oxidase family protein [Leptolyngbya iicbica]|uniref:FAD-dependent oxidoreductase n=2 Tax=Cyanophyceae TaxID=3028117 RepID=A0A4Q7EIZ6_9CYAN|nr:NAD(P)/FAD-dependent oxidoreductase [Leptolyngbya sp. LK]RZM81759.1 FAD-dependent oxidoreductase [Leptolyngbya sp. LK]
MTEIVTVASPAETLIVGAGLAGLVTAYRLKQFGIDVDIVEARDRPGGRIHSVTNALGTSLTAELGGEAFDSDHVACLTLAQELGLPVVDLWSQADAGAEDLFWFGQQRLDPQAIQAEFTALLRAQPQDWQAVQQFLQTGERTPVIQSLDALSIADYLSRHGVSRSLYQALTTAYTIKYGMDSTRQSCLNLLSYFKSAADCQSLFGNSDERYYLQGGNAQLPQALFAAVGDRVQLATQLETLAARRDGQYVATLRQGQTVRDRSYRRVVLTLPFSVLRHLDLQVDLPPSQRQAIQQLGYSTPTKVISAYRTKVWRQQGLNGLAYTDLAMQHCWEACDSLRSSEIALLVAYPGGAAGQAITTLDLADLAPMMQADLAQLFPGICAAQLTPDWLRSQWLTDPFSAGAYSCYEVGQWSAFYGFEGQRTEHLFFAGEHCSRRYQGYMEGACETAEQVTLAILQDIGHQPAIAAQQQRLQHYQQSRQSGFSLTTEGR